MRSYQQSEGTAGRREETVRVDIKRHLDLRLAARHGRDAVQIKFAEEVVVLGHGALALEDLDEHARLVVRVGRERLRLLRGHGRVALDERGHDAAGGLQA